ncbi:hypothetical protein N7522_000605 [Penicillium canescens]|uniref:Carrier domain-containing protein n=2 Tax=Penicillium canescens TaxID=5083 RepID=A0AAD6ICM0_PENCN|nr:hypothetical protein N7522_000605 [Penicillium canescens]KAJ6039221.1 hypothetical protein N7460_007253 [Penicillium canescens]
MGVSGYIASMSCQLEPCNFPPLVYQPAHPEVEHATSIQLSAHQTTQLTRFCEQNGVRFPSILQAAWAVILRCYVGSDSILFAYRDAESSFWVCGDQFDGSDPIIKHLERQDASSATCWAMPECEWPQPGQNLFNSSLAIYESGENLGNRPGTSGQEPQTQDGSKLPILVEFERHPGFLSLTLRHASSVLDQPQGQRLANTLLAALEGITSGHPSRPVADLELIAEDDLQQIWEWNRSIPNPLNLCAHHLFEQQARSTCNDPAIASWDGNMTYAELDRCASVLGAHLSSRGIGPEMIVPICFEKCRWTVVAMMAVLKAGAAFATLDPAQPTERLDTTIDETKGTLVIVASSQAGRFDRSDREILTNIPEICQQPDALPFTAFSLSVQSSNLAYVAFTSGSTGKPKGVMHLHSGACSVMTMKDRGGQDTGYGPGSRILQFASQAFAASVVEILKTLGNGGCLCIPSEETRLGNIANFMAERAVTRAFFTPSLLKLFTPESFPTLQILLVGGEPVLPDLIRAWSGKLRLIEAIGMTEGVAIQTTITPDGQVAQIGQTMSGAAWIVDPENIHKLVPIGAVGELLVEGPCLAKGYLHDDEKTNAFVDMPLWSANGPDHHPNRKFRLYRTGDLARYVNDGVVRIQGRKDSRVKLHGQRIELGDVEHHMQAGLPVSMAAAADVVAPYDADDQPFLVGFVFASKELGNPNGPGCDLASETTREQIAPLVPELKLQMALSLPSYMVPTVFLPLECQPTNTSGKLDRKRLRQIASALSIEQFRSFTHRATTTKTPPSTRTEKILQSLWADLFNVNADQIGLSDDFIMYGGNSLTAVKLAGLARARGIRLTAGGILQKPGLREMSLVAKAVDSAMPDPSADTNTTLTFDMETLQHAISPREIEAVAPATDWQAWAIYTGSLKSRGWTDYLYFDFRGALDISRLEHACSCIVAHFPIFRTVFAVHRRRMLQIVLRNSPVELIQHKGRGETDDPDAVAKQVHDRDLASTVSMGDPVLQFTLVQQDVEHNVLVLRISHAQYDALSLPLLFRAIKDAYNGLALQPAPSFMDVLHCTQEEDIKASVRFWRDRLQGSLMTQILPRSKPTYHNIVNEAMTRTIPLPSLLHHRITTAAIVHAAWSIVLGNLSGASDVVFGSLISRRHSSLSGIQDVLGPCLNITPVRTQFSPSMTVVDLLRQVQARQVDSLLHGHVGFRHIIEACTDWPSWIRFSSIVNHVHIAENMSPVVRLRDDLTFQFDVFEPAHDKSDLWLQTKPTGEEMEVELRFCGAVIPRALAERVLQRYCEVIQRLQSDVDAPLSSLVGSEVISFSLRAPRTVTSHAILPFVKATWREVLFRDGEDTENISMSTPFYEVWGDLAGATALCQIYRRRGFDVSVEDVVDNPTVEKQAQLLASHPLLNGV